MVRKLLKILILALFMALSFEAKARVYFVVGGQGNQFFSDPKTHFCPSGYSSSVTSCPDGQTLETYISAKMCKSCTGTACLTGYSTAPKTALDGQEKIFQSTNGNCSKIDGEACLSGYSTASKTPADGQTLGRQGNNTKCTQIIGTACLLGYSTSAKTPSDGQTLDRQTNNTACTRITGNACTSGYTTATSCAAHQNTIYQSNNNACKACQNKSCSDYGYNSSTPSGQKCSSTSPYTGLTCYYGCCSTSCPSGYSTSYPGGCPLSSSNGCGETCYKYASCCSDTCPSGSSASYSGSYAGSTGCGTRCYYCQESCPPGTSRSYSGTYSGYTSECGRCYSCSNKAPTGYSATKPSGCYDTASDECGNTYYKALSVCKGTPTITHSSDRPKFCQIAWGRYNVYYPYCYNDISCIVDDGSAYYMGEVFYAISGKYYTTYMECMNDRPNLNCTSKTKTTTNKCDAIGVFSPSTPTVYEYLRGSDDRASVCAGTEGTWISPNCPKPVYSLPRADEHGGWDWAN